MGKGIVLAVVSPKGGAGKTTTTANLAVAWSHFGRKILAIDTNVTTASLGYHFGIMGAAVTFKDVLDQDYSLLHASYYYNANLQVIPSALSLEIRDQPLVLQEKIRKLTDHYDILLSQVINRYDIILLDSAPGFNAESIAAMLAADGLIMVVNPETPAIIAAAKGIEYAKLLKRKVVGVVLNKKMFARYEPSREQIEHALRMPILEEIPYDENILRALAHKHPVADFKPCSKAAIAYKKLAAGLLGMRYAPGLWERMRGFFGW